MPLLLQPAHAVAEKAAALAGTATDAAGHPLPGAIIRVISDPATHPSHPWRYTLVGDTLGKFSQEGLAPGAYLVMLFPGGQASSILRRIELQAGAVQQLDLHLPVSVAAELSSAGTSLSRASHGRISASMR